MEQLTDEQKAILDFERARYAGSQYAGAKESTVREQFDCSATVYYQRLNHVLDLPAAQEYDPLTTKRLRRLREARAGQRSARSRGVQLG